MTMITSAAPFAERRETPVLSDQDKALAVSLRSTIRNATSLFRSLDGRHRVTSARLSLMGLILKGPQRVSVLARELAIRVPSVTEQVICLERDGLVERHPDPTDSRAVLVAITSAGRKLYLEELEARTVALGARLATLTDAEKVLLADALMVLNRVIEG
ncbi:MarR family winged helix-turn-helix transcriptional regulator [Falsarthrobacter nasiphocae]|uniref:DNA-binding MarR family transcriptional regulator n=1 Tax=Falsarthrobacter nasiphocae TaxID=189863 RepID=A0AAE3YHT6_9MICC|nr:MarR family transcriptional regulator [Falsarthrobacter nasiphocae]MDR6892475.1 DNA-binding MarR family transcriptional regulator [Falsarthrobacter nasiphocae]